MNHAKFSLIAGLLAACIPASLAAEISIGGIGGFTYTLDKLGTYTDEGYTVNQSGVPLMGEIGWKFNPWEDVPLFGDIALTAGARGGHIFLESIVPPEGLKPWDNINIETYPIYAFVRVDSDYLWADAGVGVHFSKLTYKTDVSDMSNDAMNFTYSVSLGARYTFFRFLTFRAGPALYYFRLDNFNGKAVNLMAVGGIASFSLEF